MDAKLEKNLREKNHLVYAFLRGIITQKTKERIQEIQKQLSKYCKLTTNDPYYERIKDDVMFLLDVVDNLLLKHISAKQS